VGDPVRWVGNNPHHPPTGVNRDDIGILVYRYTLEDFRRTLMTMSNFEGNIVCADIEKEIEIIESNIVRHGDYWEVSYRNGLFTLFEDELELLT